MKRLMIAIAMLGLVAAQSEAATMPSYGSKGTINGAAYSFTAVATGDVLAYFVGATAGYTSEVGLSVNGGAVIYGLSNKSAVGASKNFGSVTIGDSLEFVLKITAGPLVVPQFVSSDPADNAPYDGVAGFQHVYSAAYAGGDPGFPTIPAGTFVGFEDLSALDTPPLGDRDYDDHMFVFTNVAVADVPEPATMTMLGIGLAGIAGYRLRRRKLASV